MTASVSFEEIFELYLDKAGKWAVY